MNESSLGERITTAGIVVLVLVALPSVALQSYLGVDIKPAFVVTIPLVFLLRRNRIRFGNSGKLLLVLSLLSAITAIAWLWSTLMSQLLMGLTLLTMITLSWLTTRASFSRQSVSFLYRLTVMMLAGAWIGFLYSLNGGAPTYCFGNPDGSQNCLYLATFAKPETVAYWGAIRPAGIFDEPGALSFFTTLVVCLNELCDGGRKRSLILFSLGLVTLSLAHVFCFGAYAAIALRRRVAYLALVLVVLAAPLSDLLIERLAASSPMIAQFLDRFSIKDDRLSGDNRSNQVTEFFSLVDYDVSRYGSNAMSKYNKGWISSEDQSSNPFSIWFGYGFIMWIPYAITLVVLCRNMFERERPVQITAVLLVLLLLQRPYIYSLYWGLAIWSVVALMFIRKAGTGVEADLAPQENEMSACESY
jgi:hypothetical protein